MEQQQEEKESPTLASLPKISAPMLSGIVKRLGRNSAIGDKKDKKVGEGKSKKAKNPRYLKDFTAQFQNDTEKEEYSELIEKLVSTIGTLTNAPVVTVGDKFMFSDSYIGLPIPYYVFSIPTAIVGKKKETGKLPCTDDYIGSFINEISMITFLITKLKLSPTHKLVRDTCEHHGINLEKRFPLSSINEFDASVYNARCMGGSGPLPNPSQLSKNMKSLRYVWFYNRPGSDIQDKRYSIDTDKLLQDISKSQELSYNFNCYKDFEIKDNEIREKKKNNALVIAQYQSFIKIHGLDSCNAILEDAKKNKSSPSKKRKRGGQANNNSPQENEEDKKDEKFDILMEKISGKISRGLANNYFEDSLISEEEEELTSNNSSSSGEEEEEEEIVVPLKKQKLSPASKRRDNKRSFIL